MSANPPRDRILAELKRLNPMSAHVYAQADALAPVVEALLAEREHALLERVTTTIEAQPSTWLEVGDPRVNDPVPYLERDAVLTAVRGLGDTHDL